MMTRMAANADYDLEQPVIEAIQKGDDYAFKELLRRQDRWVRGIIYGVIGDPTRIDDVDQQVWTTVWQRIGELRDVRNWRAWLYRLTRNAALDAGRMATRRKRQSERLAEDATDPQSPPSPPAALDQDERDRAVHSAIEALPAIYREPFVLRHLEDWSYQQIADLLELPVDTVETRLVRARRLLREALRDKV